MGDVDICTTEFFVYKRDTSNVVPSADPELAALLLGLVASLKQVDKNAKSKIHVGFIHDLFWNV